jgi:hypothetical protein
VAEENSRQKTLNNATRETEIFPVVTPAPLLWQFLLGISVNLYLLALCNPVIDYPPWPSELWSRLSGMTLRQLLHWFLWFLLWPSELSGMTLRQLLHWLFPWWANPLLPASWISGCYGRRRFAVTFGGGSLFLGILLYVSLSAEVHREGYYFWMGSIAFAILAGISLPRVP